MSATEASAPTGGPTTCPSCGAGVPAGSRFCESCGTPVGSPTPSGHDDGPAGAAPPLAGGVGSAGPLDDAPISAPTRRPASALSDPPPSMTRRPCAECGGEVGPDRYCLSCGTRAPSEREHFREQPAVWVAGVCDRGISHARNEDAMALLAAPEPGSRAVLVVLDGVSNSIDSDVASLAGAHAAREVLRMPLPAGMGTPASRGAAIDRVLGDAVAAANTAIVAVTDPDSPNPASATVALAVLEGPAPQRTAEGDPVDPIDPADPVAGTRVHVANIGDSRVYWLPDAGDGVQLSVDDSLAQTQIAAGVPREVAETSPQAHAITRWLGRDAPDLVPTVASVEIDAPGWLLVCSDGLWNYASTPAELKEQVTRAQADGAVDPAALALALVAFANGCGGQDNITVALARVGPAVPPPESLAGDETPTVSGDELAPPAPPAPPAQRAGSDTSGTDPSVGSAGSDRSDPVDPVPQPSPYPPSPYPLPAYPPPAYPPPSSPTGGPDPTDPLDPTRRTEGGRTDG